MLNEPSVDQLLKKVNSKYLLVVLAAKRARKLAEQKWDPEGLAIKPVSMALREIAEGKLKPARVETGKTSARGLVN